MKNKISYRKLVFNILRVLIPAGLLTFIFLKIDIHKLTEIFKTVNPGYFLLSVLLMNILLVVTAGIRWYYMIRKALRTWKVARYISIYWTAMFYGYFVPSNVGMDVYRVAVAGKPKKNYERHIAILLGEKIYTLVITIALMFLAFAFVYRQMEGTQVAQTVSALAAITGISVILVLVLYLLFRNRFSRLVNYLKTKIDHYVTRLASKPGSRISIDFPAFRDELPKIASQGFFIRTFLFTLILRLLLVAGGYFLFLSLGISLSFWELLFANTVFFLVFILPVSFGSLGVREGAYIIIYGLFGVSPETALAASFLALAGLVFTLSIGGLISLTDNFTRIKPGYGE